ncbi:hypothetical protein DAPPUDRAFT_116647 [Daphnia pulex]|uniref:Uncharacterized protein n=1 Tax=Daphnia pulex TaxID=6669 RepID=E9HQ07_DAPPU|nr:hypothetical protein DAPPUDRAFT_116647 [Daphnia pulex]|eukprot:EFX66178.1 hypothetical protein DAPPUDRAFT_116647 [Daphnia pulex]
MVFGLSHMDCWIGGYIRSNSKSIWRTFISGFLLFRAMKVAMLYLKKIVYTAIENADFFTFYVRTLCTMIESGPYGLNEKKKEKMSPGQSQKVSNIRESSVGQVFEDLVKLIFYEASIPRKRAVEEILPGLNPRFQLIRSFMVEQAQLMRYTFTGSEVTMRRRNGQPFTVTLTPE